jgi:hypothetical protein
MPVAFPIDNDEILVRIFSGLIAWPEVSNRQPVREPLHHLPTLIDATRNGPSGTGFMGAYEIFATLWINLHDFLLFLRRKQPPNPLLHQASGVRKKLGKKAKNSTLRLH